jgi:hypothetical protein
VIAAGDSDFFPIFFAIVRADSLLSQSWRACSESTSM